MCVLIVWEHSILLIKIDTLHLIALMKTQEFTWEHDVYTGIDALNSFTLKVQRSSVCESPRVNGPLQGATPKKYGKSKYYQKHVFFINTLYPLE